MTPAPVTVPRWLFAVLEEAMGHVPVRVTPAHHAQGVWLGADVGALVHENQRVVSPDVPGPSLLVRGRVVVPEGA